MTTRTVPAPRNEVVLTYAPGTAERAELSATLDRVASEVPYDVPLVIGGERVKGTSSRQVVVPHDNKKRLATVHSADAEQTRRAIDVAVAASRSWSEASYATRAAVFLRAAELLAGPWRARINALCMIGQSKTCREAEIDAACELIDFFRFNAYYGERLWADPPTSPPGMWNSLEARPLEGFVLAITPFNFLSIAVNLPAAPALMGNGVLWKPATQTAPAAAACLDLLTEAGLPPGVINFVPGDGAVQGQVCLDSEHLAGIHFTGSTGTFRHLWRGAADRIDRYRTFPRLVGETGGKDFIVMHPSADPRAVAVAIVRGGYEYQGQKCSAPSRVYVPKSRWADVRDHVVATLETLRVGDVRDFKTFMGAVIDERAFKSIDEYLSVARNTAKVLTGGKSDPSKGWFIQPTFVEVDDPKHRLMQEEIFGPVVTAWVYDDAKYEEALQLCDQTSPYALTGAVFARDRAAIDLAHKVLRQAAGNFYVNDKPTGAVVGQQPFGGARQSGTNDKAGSVLNLLRWVSPRTVKETFVSPLDHRYPYLD